MTQMNPSEQLRYTCDWCGQTFKEPLLPGGWDRSSGLNSSPLPHGAMSLLWTERIWGHEFWFGRKHEHQARLQAYICPACHNVSLDIFIRDTDSDSNGRFIPVFPDYPRRAVSEVVPETIRNDFTEAVRVSKISTKGSATLARRALQASLRKGFVDMKPTRKGHLYSEIEWVIENGSLPQHLNDSLHALRQMGNFGAHPSENDELEMMWDLEETDLQLCFEVLENLFFELFFLPAQREQRSVTLNNRIKEMKAR